MKRKVNYVNVEFTDKATAGLKKGDRKLLPDWLAESLVNLGSAKLIKTKTDKTEKNEKDN